MFNGEKYFDGSLSDFSNVLEQKKTFTSNLKGLKIPMTPSGAITIPFGMKRELKLRSC